MLSASTAFAQTATVTATWDRNPDSATAGYVVYYGTSSGSYQWNYDAGNQVTAQLTLLSGATYYVSVRGYNANYDLGPASNEASFTLAAPTPTPAAPTAQITASLQGTNTALVTWTTTNAVNVAINGAAVSGAGSTSVAVSVTTTFTIVATSASGATATQSATVTVVPPAPTPTPTPSPAAPGSPTNLSAAVGEGARITMTWRAPTTGGAPTGYLLYLGNTPGSSNVANAMPVGNVLRIDGDLPRGRYFARVAAVNASGVSAPSSEVRFKIGSDLVSPRGFTVRWIGTTAQLSWIASASDGSAALQPTTYVLEAGTAPGLSDVAVVPVGNVTSFEVNIPAGAYYVRVRAVNDFGDSDPTDDLLVAAPGIPSAPTGLTASGSGATVNLRWTAPAGAAGYVLEAGTSPGLSNIATVQVGNVTQFTTQAPPGTYYVRVRALNGRGLGQPSNEIVVRK